MGPIPGQGRGGRAGQGSPVQRQLGHSAALLSPSSPASSIHLAAGAFSHQAGHLQFPPRDGTGTTATPPRPGARTRPPIPAPAAPPAPAAGAQLRARRSPCTVRTLVLQCCPWVPPDLRAAPGPHPMPEHLAGAGAGTRAASPAHRPPARGRAASSSGGGQAWDGPAGCPWGALSPLLSLQVSPAAAPTQDGCQPRGG